MIASCICINECNVFIHATRKIMIMIIIDNKKTHLTRAFNSIRYTYTRNAHIYIKPTIPYRIKNFSTDSNKKFYAIKQNVDILMRTFSKNGTRTYKEDASNTGIQHALIYIHMTHIQVTQNQKKKSKSSIDFIKKSIVTKQNVYIFVRTCIRTHIHCKHTSIIKWKNRS